MLPFNFKLLTLLTLLLLSSLQVSAHPLVIHLKARRNDAATTTTPLYTRDTQSPLLNSTSSTAHSASKSLHTLQDLYVGNTNFRQNARLLAAKVAEEAPSFMFLGCVDNRVSPAAIFNAPVGSIMSHNNIGNQYSAKDPSADAAIAYAIEHAHVQHVIVLGHYGCKGVEAAITQSSTTTNLVKVWVKPIADLYARTRRREIVVLRDSRMPRRDLPDGIKTAPPVSDAGFRALVEENVKKGVKALRKNSILAQAYSLKALKKNATPSVDVFVHGFVYDEVTGEVHDLNVSFGPPGEAIPDVPFAAVAAAKNFHRESFRPGINRGKTWDFGSHDAH